MTNDKTLLETSKGNEPKNLLNQNILLTRSIFGGYGQHWAELGNWICICELRLRILTYYFIKDQKKFIEKSHGCWRMQKYVDNSLNFQFCTSKQIFFKLNTTYFRVGAGAVIRIYSFGVPQPKKIFKAPKHSCIRRNRAAAKNIVSDLTFWHKC
jgi:hypothetical protein